MPSTRPLEPQSRKTNPPHSLFIHISRQHMAGSADDGQTQHQKCWPGDSEHLRLPLSSEGQPGTEDSGVYGIQCECGQVYIGQTV
jgi:hypothetical protein